MSKSANVKKKLSAEEQKKLLAVLKNRFEKNMVRHEGLEWTKIQAKLEAQPAKLWSLQQMEASGGEPDVVSMNQTTGEYLFFDCSPESPAGRRSFCYDEEALEARKANKPADSALNNAAEMGIDLLTEEEYQLLQQVGRFDLKTSSWLKTPPALRKLGGAIFGDRRFDRVFIYHNGAESYYAARGFRGSLRV
ncbi:DUF4256 domain-containing protein [Flavihumibacter sp. CACIAM 22H1]|uniref:DUF4256 domain-containing protein n=1 Tax=Flavihumibacter sp. CACIAM 22H1 TaxID=1812911 RepID=UPI0007A8630C|nr:DUF4256 domain-containing protein [Flavihumibacter sp. CACIAM 22H1]KYP13638.1 MAG: hypothetical protein A1D16_17905 [Flavihumibacter sp. CACIAM 22H1]